MGKSKLEFFSIILVGRQNPQILNHEFLVHNAVLPQCEPFVRKDLKEGDTPFSDFVSAPPFARIAYGKVSLLVQEDRFQAIDESGADPLSSPIIPITRRYFGDLLKFTPLKIGGLNLNYEVTFATADEEEAFDAGVGVAHDRARTAFATPRLIASMTSEFPFLEGKMSVMIGRSLETPRLCRINFNYEFAFPGDMSTFLKNLDRVGEVADYQAGFSRRVGIVG